MSNIFYANIYGSNFMNGVFYKYDGFRLGVCRHLRLGDPEYERIRRAILYI